MVPSRRLALIPVLVVLSAGCAGPAGDAATSSSNTSAISGEVLVSAAASLTDAFAEMEAAFEADHPGTDVILNLGPSSGLREQILEGAPVDVFASANTANMDQVAGEGLVAGESWIFAHNRLAIAVPAGNPAGITGLPDLGREDLLIGLCAAAVPCGDFARTALALAGVDPAIDTNEPDVRALLTKLGAGELDAGITYLTDVVAAGGEVEAIDMPDEANVVADYPIAVMTYSPNPGAAAAFVDFVISDAGGRILVSHGFEAP
jgi:molybdate transport system substrate-binding protein